MRSRFLSISLITTVICGLFVSNLTTETASAKGDNSLFWDAPVSVSQPAKPKPGRVRPPSRPKPDPSTGREKNPLLTLKYNMLVRGASGNIEKADPAKREWKVGDQLRLAVTPNQNGFLYIVHQSVDDNGAIIDQPHIIFPDPGINQGGNQVVKNTEYVVPNFCAQFENPDDCWWEITPPGGTDSFTLIFSRDQITDLQNRLTKDDAKKGKDSVKMETIAAIKKTSNTKSIARSDKIQINSTSKPQSDGIYVQNTSKDDNEELFEVIDLKHPSKGTDDPVALTRALFAKKRSDAMHVSFIKTNGGSVDPANDVFKENDEIEVRCRSNFNGYVYFVNITPAGRKYLIFPCGKVGAFNLEPGATVVTPVGFDSEKGTEVLQVIMTRERIDFLEAAIRGDCCADPTKCELSASAASAAAELASTASKNQKGGISVNNLLAVVPANASSGGIRARGIKLAQGPDSKSKGSTYVAIESPADSKDNKLEAGRFAVFEIRLNHN